jgi:hypothetical protein
MNTGASAFVTLPLVGFEPARGNFAPVERN